MKGRVTSKGRVTIPKKFRDKFGIQPGTQVDFVAAEDGIHLRKVVERRKKLDALGCLKKELAGRSVSRLMADLRGPVECQRLQPGKRSASAVAAVGQTQLLDCTTTTDGNGADVVRPAHSVRRHR